MQVWNVLHELAGNAGPKNSPKIAICTITQLCRAISSQLRHISTIRKKLVNQQYLLQISTQYGELWPTNGWDWFVGLGRSSIFQRVSRLGFVIAAMSFTGGQPHFARCLIVIRSSILYVHFSWAFAPWRNFTKCKLHVASKSCIHVYWQRYCIALDQWASAKLCGVVQGMELQNFCRGRHLYSAGRPSRWASAHILVDTIEARFKDQCHRSKLTVSGGKCSFYVNRCTLRDCIIYSEEPEDSS